jgi:dihydroorotate dehydrogenase subfamily 1
VADLSTTVNGMRFQNPFLLASGPPGTNGKVIQRSFSLGWGGIVCKTISLDNSKVINTVPRYGKLYSKSDPDEVIGFQNIELISDRPFEAWLEELADCKRAYPDHVLIASVMEEYSRERWQEIIERTQATGIDGFELNLSCPHGLPERKMGAAMGEHPEIVEEVVGWVKSVARVPVWAKMTPNITDPAVPAKAAVKGGADGISAINTVLCIIGVNLETLRPMPTVEGFSEPGGYSGPAVRPIALRHVMQIARACPGRSISGMGGIETAEDAAQFLLLGAHTVQVCTAAMLRGYEMIEELCRGMERFMDRKGFESVSEIVGKSLPYFSTHADLVARQAEAKREKAAARTGRDGTTWKGDIARDTDALVAE